jgi:hypothetical protein
MPDTARFLPKLPLLRKASSSMGFAR